LGKFINLVKNEYIKMSLKKSTWIMLIILLIGCIGYPFAVKFAEYQLVGDNYSDSEEYSIDDYKEQIAYLKDVKTEGWENEVECIQYKIDNNITSGWKIGAADEMFNVKYNSDESYKFSQEQTDNCRRQNKQQRRHGAECLFPENKKQISSPRNSLCPAARPYVPFIIQDIEQKGKPCFPFFSRCIRWNERWLKVS
jgi:hypothetical protein